MYRTVCIFLLLAVFESVVSLPKSENILVPSKVDSSCLVLARISNEEAKTYQNLQMGPTYDARVACYNMCIWMKARAKKSEGVLDIENTKEKGAVVPALDAQWKSTENPCEKFYTSTKRLYDEVSKAANPDQSLLNKIQQYYISQ